MAVIKLDKNGNAVGKSGADTIYGNGKTNILGGMGGNDTLWGRGGHDFIDGGAGNDKIIGGAGTDIMSGGSGRDTLTGGSGYDFFAFESKLSKSAIDTVTDFNVKSDTIMLWNRIFKVTASADDVISSDSFWTGSKAHDASDRIIYNKKTGGLYYDPDGTGAKKALQFAALDKNLKMTHMDFIIF